MHPKSSASTRQGFFAGSGDVTFFMLHLSNNPDSRVQIYYIVPEPCLIVAAIVLVHTRYLLRRGVVLNEALNWSSRHAITPAGYEAEGGSQHTTTHIYIYILCMT